MASDLLASLGSRPELKEIEVGWEIGRENPPGLEIRFLAEELPPLRVAILVTPSGRRYLAKYEPWQTICIVDYAEKLGVELEKEDDWWEVLDIAISQIKEEEGWDHVVYIDPELAEEAYGATVWLKALDGEEFSGDGMSRASEEEADEEE